jgi:hypothetical protein
VLAWLSSEAVALLVFVQATVPTPLSSAVVPGERGPLIGI